MSRELTIEELTSELEALRETPSHEFAGRLDALAAAGFGGGRPELLGRIGKSLRHAAPRKRLLPALAAAASVIVVATAVVVATDGGGGSSEEIHTLSAKPPAAEGAAGAGRGAALGAAKAAPAAGAVASPLDDFAPPPRKGGGAPGVRDRQVERSAELTLGTDPDRVQEVSGKVIDVVGRYRGFVLSSSVRDGTNGDAGARFELLIPSARLSPALADLSGIAEVRSRSENTLDITAPYVSAREHLRDNRAEAQGLLRQLAEADTDAERASVKAQLQVVRGRIAAFRAQVDRLQRRSNFSRVSLDVVTGSEGAAVPTGDDGDWSVIDALHDAGRVLAVAAGVTLLAAALILPLALLGAAGWAGRRAYLRRARAQTLGQSPS